MIPSGIWGGQPDFDGDDSEHPITDSERVRAFYIPNYWVANDGRMGEYGADEHFMTQYRWFGDVIAPGIIDNKNWKISFNEDGTVLLVSTWTTFDDTAALQLVKYTDDEGNECITMIGCYGERWQYSEILSNCTVISGAYLYASEPVYDETSHTCDFGDWYDTADESTHERACTICGETEEAPHSFYDWIAKDNNDHVHECMECDYESVLPHDYEREVTKEPTETEVGEATYTCTLCSHSYTEELPKKIVQISGDVVGTVLNVPSGSNAYIPEGTVFDVVEQPVEQVPEQVLGEIAVTAEGAAKPLGMFDLSLLLDGATIQPNGMVSITLPAPDLAAEYDKIIVVYIAPDGSFEECSTTLNDDGTITFETDHFSAYAVIGILLESGKGGAIAGIVIGSVLGAIVLGIGGFLLVWFVVKKKNFADLMAIFKRK